MVLSAEESATQCLTVSCYSEYRSWREGWLPLKLIAEGKTRSWRRPVVELSK